MMHIDTNLQTDVFWSLLAGGGTLTVAGLYKNSLRYRSFRRAKALMEGEIAPAELAFEGVEEIEIRPVQETARNTPMKPLRCFLEMSDRRSFQCLVDTSIGHIAFMDTEIAAWIRPGVWVRGESRTATALYRFDIRVRDMKRDREGWLFTFDRPVWADRIQRRQHVRANTTLPASLEPVEGPLAGQAHHAVIRNLSAGGFCADLNCSASPRLVASALERFGPEASLRVRMSIPGLGSEALPARVLTAERIYAPGGLGARISCCFLSLPDWQQEQMVSFVFKTCRDQRWGEREKIRA